MTLNRMAKLSWIYDLYRLGQGAASLEETPRLYQQILTHIVDGFDGKSGSLALLNHKENQLVIVGGIDLPQGVVGSTVEIGACILGWVVENRTPLLLNGSVASDSRFRQLCNRAQTGTPSSAICWPLKIEDRVIGALSVNRPAEKPPFAEADLEQGTALLNLVSLALGNIQLQVDQQRRIGELKEMNHKLEEAHSQLLQSEKMASIGQLAAGVAHEINNPIGYVYSNLGTLEKYMENMFSMLDAYEQSEPALSADALGAVKSTKSQLDLEFLKEDIPALMNESREGISRVKQIVQNLKDFSHAGAEDEWQWANLHKGLDSTLNIVWNEIKYKAEVVKEYGAMPDIECLPSQLNQVFMNLLVNAAHAIETPDAPADGKGRLGTITVRTGADENQVWVEIADTGKGIPPENMKRIFDPFFTTKPIGKGTGLGLSLSYGIVQKHKGKIEVGSEVGKGTTFRVWLPIRHEE